MYNRKNIVIIIMIIVIMFMAVGYAAFSVNITITGTGNIGSKWSVYFTKIETISSSSGATNVTLPEASGLTATFNNNLKAPGDYITYRVTLVNDGTLDAVVNDITATKAGNSAIIYTIEGLKQGDVIAKGATKTITIKIEFDINATSLPSETGSVLTMKLNVIQHVNQNISGENVTITQASTATTSGTNSITTTNALSSFLYNYKIEGNSVQNGTPSPTTPVEIESVGEKTKNLLDINNYTITGSPTFEIVDGHIVARIDWSNSVTYKITGLDPNKQYTFSFKKSEESKQFFYVHDVRGNWFATYSQPTTVTPTAEGIVSIVFASGVDGVWFDYDIYDLQLEEGTAATEYEPYDKYKVPITVSNEENSYNETYNIFLDEPLRCIENNCDYIDFRSKQLVRQVAVKKVSSNSYDWELYTGYGVTKAYRIKFSDMLNIDDYDTRDYNYVMSNAFVPGAYVSKDSATGIGWSEAQYVYFRFDGNNYGVTNVETFENFLDSYNIYVYYPLAVQAVETIKLPNIYIPEGNTTVSVNSNGLTIPLTLTYYTK